MSDSVLPVLESLLTGWTVWIIESFGFNNKGGYEDEI